MKKLTTIEMIGELIKDRNKKFESKNCIGERTVCSFEKGHNNEIFLYYEDGTEEPITMSYGVSGSGGVLDWFWEEVGQTDWSKVAIDTKVLVSDNGATWEKRYFSKYENNEIVTWGDGSTSWSATYEISWKYAKLAE